jgi:GNAT superfamily N-acetyltransferase
VHPHFSESMAAQRRVEFMARAEAYRQAARAKRADERPHLRVAYDSIVAGATPFEVRPVEPTDGARLTRLVARMSPTSRRLRFFGPVNRLSARQVDHFVNVDHFCREALLAVRDDEIVAVARYDGNCDAGDAEVALAVEDRWQRHGIGRQLSRKLVRLAMGRNFDTITATILPENRAALGLVHAIAPSATVAWSDGAYRVTIPLVSA